MGVRVGAWGCVKALRGLGRKEGHMDTGASGRGLLLCTQGREETYHRLVGMTLPPGSCLGSQVHMLCVPGMGRGGVGWWGEVAGMGEKAGLGVEGEGGSLLLALWIACSLSHSWQVPTAAPSCLELTSVLCRGEKHDFLKSPLCTPRGVWGEVPGSLTICYRQNWVPLQTHLWKPQPAVCDQIWR